MADAQFVTESSFENMNQVLYDTASSVQGMGNAFDGLRQTLYSQTVYLQAAQMNIGSLPEPEAQPNAAEGDGRGSGGAGSFLSALSGRLTDIRDKAQKLTELMNFSDSFVQAGIGLDAINDGLQSTAELTDMVRASAMAVHAPFLETAAAAAQMGRAAAGAFSSNEEMLAFMTQANKQFAVGGAAPEERSAAMSQLTQGMSSGTFNAEGLSVIEEAAPGIGGAIEQSMGWAEGSLAAYAEKGAVTAETVKAVMFGMADETNAKFNNLPVTFGQAMTNLQTLAENAFLPVMLRINELINSPQFEEFAVNAGLLFSGLANIILQVFDAIGKVGAFMADHWSVIAPIIYGIIGAMGAYLAISALVVAINGAIAIAEAIKTGITNLASGSIFVATAAQTGFNTSLLACPLTWIILLVIALIAIIFAVCGAIAEATGVTQSGFGLICGAINVGKAAFINLALLLANIATGICLAMEAVKDNIKAAFQNAIADVQIRFYSLLSTALLVIGAICEALNKLPFIEIDYSGITDKAAEYASRAAELEAGKQEYVDIGEAFHRGFNTFDAFKEGWADEAFQKGAAFGDASAQAISEFSLSDWLGGGEQPLAEDDFLDNYNGWNEMEVAGMSGDLSSIAEDTGSISDSVDVSEEDLRYLRDIAEQEAVNRFTTAEIRIDMGGVTNNLTSGIDLDGFITRLTDSVAEAVEISAEGTH